jgi:signal transduction histidine kinase
VVEDVAQVGVLVRRAAGQLGPARVQHDLIGFVAVPVPLGRARTAFARARRSGVGERELERLGRDRLLRPVVHRLQQRHRALGLRLRPVDGERLVAAGDGDVQCRLDVAQMLVHAAAQMREPVVVQRNEGMAKDHGPDCRCWRGFRPTGKADARVARPHASCTIARHVDPRPCASVSSPAAGAAAAVAAGASAAPLVITQVEAVAAGGDRYPTGHRRRPCSCLMTGRAPGPPRGQRVVSREFRSARRRLRHDLLVLYIERVCSTAEVFLNGHRIHSSGRMTEPLAHNCYRPQLVTLPAALLKSNGNTLDLHVVGSSLQRVAALQRAGGLSTLAIGPQSHLAPLHDERMFWNITVVELMALTLLIVGGFMLGLYWQNRREVPLFYFGALLVAWAALSARIWWRDLPLSTATVEFIACCAFPWLVGCLVQFLLSYATLRSRLIEAILIAQCVLVPATLLLAGPSRLYTVANAWTSLFALEVFGAIGLYLTVVWRHRRPDFAPMLMILVGVSGLLVYSIAVQLQALQQPPVQILHFAVPLLFLFIGSRLLQVFSRALSAAEASRSTLEQRIKEVTAEIERNFAQLSELRVEQVTEKERKRIAADLHDDLGAKLLTIVHTSESERISTLAREALEEMRLSVRGLTGKPVRLADALADWRAETVLRLGQANIECDWKGPAEEIEHLLPARAYVQTTRILREAVSNIIKHSAASHCKFRSSVGERDFGLLIQDNGKGIPMELDGKLDRGHGMSSMKHRAKQLQGQCLVESGPGYGTVIRLTLPL